MQFNIVSSIKKKRYSFVYENKFYKLDLFSDGLMVLEVGVDCYKERISFPDEITVIEDVTNDTQYNNINYGTKINQNIKKRELV